MFDFRDLEHIHPAYKAMCACSNEYVNTVRRVGYFLRLSADCQNAEDLLRHTLDHYIEASVEAYEASIGETELAADDVVLLTKRLVTCRESLKMWPMCLGRVASEPLIPKIVLEPARSLYIACRKARKHLPTGDDIMPRDTEHQEIFRQATTWLVDNGLRNMGTEGIPGKCYRRWKTAEGRFRRWQSEGFSQKIASDMALGFMFEQEKPIDASALQRNIDKLPTYLGRENV